MRRLVVVGDALLDRDVEGRAERLAPDAPAPVVEELACRSRPGGAGLAAALAAADGREVTLVTAIGRDRPGDELRSLLDQAGVEVVEVGLDGPTPEKVRIRAGGRTLLRLDRGGGQPGRPGAPNQAALRALASGAGLLVSDYGRGLSGRPDVRAALATLAGRQPVVWDPHPKGADPVPEVRLATPNRAETGAGPSLAEVARRARELRRGWRIGALAVTLGREGALLVEGDGPPTAVPAPDVLALDPCGAGDRFAATAAGLLADGAPLSPAVAGAVAAASAFVAAGGAGTAVLGRSAELRPEPHDRGLGRALRMAATARARGERVVATGGCFDLLHAGHVSGLRSARTLGGCLVVCLNSDASTRRLKGPGRPVVGEGDRAAMLEALACVDAVILFDEDTPEAVLERLRPDLFVKGGDYAAVDIPEARLLARWGGEVVLLPYLDGRSTTRLLEEMARGGL